MAQVDLEKLLSAIDAHRTNSYGSDEQSTLGQKRAQALASYLGLNQNPAPEGRSQVVDRSVYETIQTMLPSLVRIFAASSESICKFLPVGPDDEQAAEQTTAVINHTVTELNNWEQICADWIFDAAIGCNGYAIAYWDESEKIIRERYDGQADDQLAALTSDKGVAIVEQSSYVDAQMTADAAEAHKLAMQRHAMMMQQWQQAAMQAQQQGRQPPPPPQAPPPPGEIMLHDVVIERKENDGKVCIEVLPQEHCYVSVDTPDWTLRRCPYFEFRQEKTIAELRSMGLDVADDVSDDETEDSEEDWTRDRFAEDRYTTEGDEIGVMRRVWARMIWLDGDFEGDDVSRCYYVIAVGRTILYVEPVGGLPVASMTPQPLPHRHIGMSIAETVVDLQDTKTAIKRGALDNLYQANSPRAAISSRVNLDDYLDMRPGNPIRMIDDSLPGEGHIVPVVHPFAFDQIIGSLEYFDQERQNRTGASRYFSGTDANAINKTASGTIALQNMAAMRVEHVARMMAPAVEELFRIVHELVQKHKNKPQAIKLRGQWVNVDPQAWRTKRDVRISVGVGAGNKDSMLQQLGMIYGAQMQLLPLGLAGPTELHASVTEMAKLAGFANPAKFWRDPSQLPPQQPQPSPDQIKAQSAMQIEQFRAQQEQLKAQAEQQIETQRLQMQAEVDKQREEMQARQKMLEAQGKAELEAQKASIEAQKEAQRLEFERWRAELDATVKLQIAQMSKPPEAPDTSGQVLATLGQLAEAVRDLGEPAQIIRDQSGRAVGVQRGKRSQSIVRGPDGRAIGLQ